MNKKALEAGIKYCDKEVEKTLSNDTAFLCNRIVKNTLCEMLAAIDAEPEKPEQMSKHELVQEVYKLAGMNQKLVEALEKCIEQFQYVHFCSDCGREEDKKVIDEAKQTLAKYKELK